MTDKERGLYRKYDVSRIDDPQKKHSNCSFFVLDLDHDPFAAIALRAYAVACRDEYPLLANDLWNQLPQEILKGLSD